MNTILLLVILCLVNTILIESKGMWGSKRKRQDDEDDISADLSRGFQSKQKLASNRMDIRSSQSNDSKAKVILDTFDLYVNAMNQFMMSPQFDSVMSPSSMRSLLSKLPGMSGSSQYDELLETMETMGSEELKAQMQLGLQTAREYLAELISISSDPSKLEEALNAIPIEGRDVVEGLIKGDLTPLKNKILDETTLDKTIKMILVSLLDGDIPTAIEHGIKFLKQNPETLESMRKSLLEQPEMLESVGFPREILNDKKQFMSTIEEGLRMLGQMYASGGLEDMYGSAAGGEDTYNSIESSFDGSSSSSGSRGRKNRFAAAA